MQKTRLVVIGNGMVGQHLVDTLAETAADRFELTVCGEETRPAYDRVHLTEYFGEKTADELALTTPDFYARHGFSLRTATPVTTIDRAARTRDDRGRRGTALRQAGARHRLVSRSCRRCRAASGRAASSTAPSRIWTPSAPAAQGAQVGVVIGGGLLGLEAAKALQGPGPGDARGRVRAAPDGACRSTTAAARVLRAQDRGAGRARAHRQATRARSWTAKPRRHRMRVRRRRAPGNGHDRVLGRHPPARRAGPRLRPGRRRARRHRGRRPAAARRDPDIYAIGECALWSGRIYGLVAPGYQMAQDRGGRICCGGEAGFTGADMSTKLKLLGVDVASIGDAHATTPGARVLHLRRRAQASVYKKLVVSDDGKRLLGAVLVGDATDYGTCCRLMLNGMQLPAQPRGADPAGTAAAAKPASGVDSAAGHRADLLLQQRQQGRAAAPPSTAAAPRSAR